VTKQGWFLSAEEYERLVAQRDEYVAIEGWRVTPSIAPNADVHRYSGWCDVTPHECEPVYRRAPSEGEQAK